MPAFDQWMDKKVYNKKRYEKAVRGYLNWRRKNPKAGSTGAFDYLRRWVLSVLVSLLTLCKT